MGVTSLAACNIEVGISLEIPPPDPREVRWELSGLVLARTPISFSRLHTFRRCPIAFWLAISILVLFPGVASAHPMGNFSINHYSRIVPGERAIELEYIIDMAEIPTFQEIQGGGLVAKIGDPGVAPYIVRQSESLKRGLTLEIDGSRLRLDTVSRQAILPPGAGGLPTMKMAFVYRAALQPPTAASLCSLHYVDGNFPGRAGWKEIIAIGGPRVVLAASSVPSRDRSLELTNYPTDMLHSPPQTLEASVIFKAAPPGSEDRGGSVTAAGWLGPMGMRLKANRQGTPRSAFTDLIKSDRMDLGFLLTAAIIAAVLGGFHALEPGHGKTLVAAYLVGSRGTARQAVVLGATVTASHTMSVYALGIVTLYASRWVVPEQLYPWLGTASGLIVAGLGCTLFVRRCRSADAAHTVVHEHTAVHEHHHESHRHHASDTPRAPLSFKSLFALGVTGGIVPCPAALVVLLSALAIHRLAFGLFLIVAFSVGLAALLIGLGLATVFAGRFMSRFAARGPLTEQWLPLLSSAVITAVGITLAAQSLASAGVLRV